MPLMLSKEMELKWLQPFLSDEEMQEIFHFEMPSEQMEYHPVFTIRTTKDRPDGQDKLDVYQWENLPPLGVDTTTQTLF